MTPEAWANLHPGDILEATTPNARGLTFEVIRADGKGVWVLQYTSGGPEFRADKPENWRKAEGGLFS